LTGLAGFVVVFGMRLLDRWQLDDVVGKCRCWLGV
jgi:hypothetical protein